MPQDMVARVRWCVVRIRSLVRTLPIGDLCVTPSPLWKMDARGYKACLQGEQWLMSLRRWWEVTTWQHRHEYSAP